jgi:hypothetical protein
MTLSPAWWLNELNLFTRLTAGLPMSNGLRGSVERVKGLFRKFIGESVPDLARIYLRQPRAPKRMDDMLDAAKKKAPGATQADRIAAHRLAEIRGKALVSVSPRVTGANVSPDDKFALRERKAAYRIKSNNGDRPCPSPRQIRGGPRPEQAIISDRRNRSFLA